MSGDYCILRGNSKTGDTALGERFVVPVRTGTYIKRGEINENKNKQTFKFEKNHRIKSSVH